MGRPSSEPTASSLTVSSSADAACAMASLWEGVIIDGSASVKVFESVIARTVDQANGISKLIPGVRKDEVPGQSSIAPPKL